MNGLSAPPNIFEHGIPAVHHDSMIPPLGLTDEEARHEVQRLSDNEKVVTDYLFPPSEAALLTNGIRSRRRINSICAVLGDTTQAYFRNLGESRADAGALGDAVESNNRDHLYRVVLDGASLIPEGMSEKTLYGLWLYGLAVAVRKIAYEKSQLQAELTPEEPL